MWEALLFCLLWLFAWACVPGSQAGENTTAPHLLRMEPADAGGGWGFIINPLHCWLLHNHRATEKASSREGPASCRLEDRGACRPPASSRRLQSCLPTPCSCPQAGTTEVTGSPDSSVFRHSPTHLETAPEHYAILEEDQSARGTGTQLSTQAARIPRSLASHLPLQSTCGMWGICLAKAWSGLGGILGGATLA